MGMENSLLRLPTELRLMIYDSYISSLWNGYHYTTEAFDVSNFTSCESITSNEQKLVRTYSFLFVHPVVFAEALPLVLKSHWLLFWDINTFAPLLQKFGQYIDHAQMITLDFGKCTPRKMRTALKLLYSRDMPQLGILEIAVGHPRCLPGIYAPRTYTQLPSLSMFGLIDLEELRRDRMLRTKRDAYERDIERFEAFVSTCETSIGPYLIGEMEFKRRSISYEMDTRLRKDGYFAEQYGSTAPSKLMKRITAMNIKLECQMKYRYRRIRGMSY